MKYLHRAIAILSKAIILSFMLAVIVLAVVSSLLRYYTPLIADYKEPILERVNAASDAFHVKAELISGEWQPLQPILILENVEVEISGQDEVISLKKLRLGLDLFLSLYYRSLYFEEVQASNLSLVLKQSKAGLWGLKRTAEKAAAEPTSSNALKNTVLRLWRVNHLVLDQLEITLEPYGFDKVKLPVAEVELLGDENYKYLHAIVNEGERQMGKLLLEAESEPFADDFRVSAYAEFVQMDLLHYFPFAARQYGLHGAKPEGRIWLGYSDGVLDLNGSVKTTDFDFRRKDQEYQLEHFAFNYSLKLSAEEQNLWLDEINLGFSEGEIALKQWSVKRNKEQIQVFSPEVNLQTFSDLLTQLPLPEKAQQLRENLAATGRVKNLRLTAPLAELSQVDIQLDAENISTQPINHIPGFVGVSGFVHSSLQSGFIELDAEKFELFFPNLFYKPMAFAKASGHVAWNIMDKRLYLNGEELFLSSGQVAQAHGAFAIEAPLVKGQGEPGTLSLVIGAKGSEAKYRNTFIPKTLPKNLLDWLDQNILSGDVLQASYIYHGPFKRDQGEMRVNQLWLDLEQASLSYLEQWPNVEGVKGEFLLDGVEAFAKVTEAKVGGMSIDSAKVAITSDKKSNGQNINILARTNTSLEAAVNMLKTEGLNELLQGQAQPWQADKGKASLKVAIDVPLNQPSKTLAVTVDADVKQGEVYAKDYNLRFKDVFAHLNFDLQEGLRSVTPAKFSFLNQAASAEITSKLVNNEQKTQVLFASTAEVKQVANWLKQPFLHFLEGNAAFTGELTVAKANSALMLESDLLGVAVNLPTPFNKEKNAPQKLRIDLPLTDKAHVANLTYGNAVKGRLRFSEQGLDAIVVDLGIKKTEFVENKILVSGQLVEADVEQWLGVVERYQAFAKQQQTEISTKQASSDFEIALEALSVQKLTAYGYLFNSAQVSLFRAADYWQMGFQHAELKGHLKIFDDEKKPFVANIGYLDLLALSRREETAMEKGASGFSELPEVDFTIGELDYKGEDYGEWEFKLRSQANEIKLKNIRGSVKHLLVGPIGDTPAELSWVVGEEPQSRFIGRVTSNNIAAALAAFGYSQEVNSKHAEFDLNLLWVGEPEDFAMDKFVGTASIHLQKGNFADAKSSGTDALRILSAINLAQIVRRLKLDFSDLTGAGLAFDTVSGVLVLDKGLLQFKKPLKVNSASSQISLQGVIDINQDDLNLDMGITLPFASNLPWIAALAAGLPAAAGVYVISKVLKKQVDKLSSAIYKISGSLAEPNVEFVRVFSSE